MPTSNFSFVKLIVDDLDMMLRFYLDAFGFVIVAKFEDDKIKEVILKQSGDGMTLCLLRWKEDRFATQRNTIGILGFVTHDVGQSVKDALANGAQLIQDELKVPGSRVAFVSDPEGNEVEFVQFMPA